MIERVRSRLTYANVVSTLCLFVLLGGGAYAAVKVKKNSVKSKQIKDGAVQSRDLANGAVSAGKIAPGAINGGQIADNTITGADVDESSLEGVNAGKVGGMEIKKINFQVPEGTPVTSVLTYPGLFRIDAQCQDFGDGLDVSARTGVDGSRIQMTTVRASNANDNDGARDVFSSQIRLFNVADVFGIDDTFPGTMSDPTEVRIQFSTPTGFVSTTHLYLDETEPVGCQLTGTSIGG